MFSPGRTLFVFYYIFALVGANVITFAGHSNMKGATVIFLMIISNLCIGDPLISVTSSGAAVNLQVERVGGRGK